MIEYNPAEKGDPSENQISGITVIGIGGAGANVLDRMALEGSDDAELITLNTDVRALTSSVSTRKIQLGATLLKGMGTGGDPELGKQAALEAVDDIRSLVRKSKMLFLCVGLGGGTGSGAAPEVCRIAREEGVFLVVFATMPFSFEGARRFDQASTALSSIARYANAVITFDNDRMGELIVAKDGVTQAFAAADRIISQSIRATMNVVFRPGIIRIGMDDLLSALDADDSRCLFGYGVAKGDNRSHEALEQALKCPLLDRGKLLNEARSVLVQVAGGDSMTLFEVQLVMEEIAKHVGVQTQILFGTGTDKRLGSNLTVTIISSIAGPSATSHQTARTVEASAPSVSLGMGSGVSDGNDAPISMFDEISADSQQDYYGEVADETAVAAYEEVGYAEAPYMESDASVFEPLEEMGVSISEPEERPAYAPEPLPQIFRRERDADLNESEDVNPIARAMEAATSGLPSMPPPMPRHETPSTARVAATDDGGQTISLTRVGSGKSGAGKATVPPVLPPSQAPTMPTEEAPSYQQQEMLQLEPLVGADKAMGSSDSAIIDGEDMDVPAFLRRKKN